MDAVKLRYAVKIAECGSYSVAADALHVSQPALSRCIQILEAKYGLRIFERGRSGAKTTEAGARFIERAERFLAATEIADEELLAAASGDDLVAFGITAMSYSMFLRKLLCDVTSAPATEQVRVRIGTGQELQRLLRAGEIEFYVGSVPRDSDGFVRSKGLQVDPLPTPPLDLLINPQHPLLQVDDPQREISRFPVISGSLGRDPFKSPSFDTVGLPRVSLEVEDYETLAAIARVTDSVLLASRWLVDLRPDLGLVRLPLSIPPFNPIEFAVVTRAGHQLTGAARALCGRVRSLILEKSTLARSLSQ